MFACSLSCAARLSRAAMRQQQLQNKSSHSQMRECAITCAPLLLLCAGSTRVLSIHCFTETTDMSGQTSSAPLWKATDASLCTTCWRQTRRILACVAHTHVFAAARRHSRNTQVAVAICRMFHFSESLQSQGCLCSLTPYTGIIKIKVAGDFALLTGASAQFS